ncbi:MAG: hypothetical protein WBB78_09180, partial [Propionicimonas sp.]
PHDTNVVSRRMSPLEPSGVAPQGVFKQRATDPVEMMLKGDNPICGAPHPTPQGTPNCFVPTT